MMMFTGDAYFLRNTRSIRCTKESMWNELSTDLDNRVQRFDVCVGSIYARERVAYMLLQLTRDMPSLQLPHQRNYYTRIQRGYIFFAVSVTS